MTRRHPLAVLVTVVTTGALALAACGDDDDPSIDPTGAGDGGTGSEDTMTTDPVDAELTITTDVREAGLVVDWTVTNTGDRDLVVFDGRRQDETGDSQRLGASVVAHDDDTAEIARRLFPVAEGVESDGAIPETNATLLPQSGTLSGNEFVPLPFEFAPVAPDDSGGTPPPEDAAQAVFCVGVAAAEDFPAEVINGWEYRRAVHDEANAAHQTVLCSEPFAVS